MNLKIYLMSKLINGLEMLRELLKRGSQTMTMNESSVERRKYCRHAVALYLQTLAGLVNSGAVDGFDLQWTTEAEMPKPVGKVIFDSVFINTPLPEETKKPEPDQSALNKAFTKPIDLDDRSAILQNARACDDPDCKACNKRN